MKKGIKIIMKWKEKTNGEIPNLIKREVISKKHHMREKDKEKKSLIKGKDKDRKLLHSSGMMIKAE